MTRKEKAAGIQAMLEKLYPDPSIPLRHTNPFTLCIAVLLSAHTTDKSVNAATPALFALADNPAAMTDLGPERIQALIKKVGLSKTKSRNVWNLSRILMEKHGGKLPETMEGLEELPGVGHKTASVVLCQAFGKQTFPVDTHIHRLAERWGLSDGKNVVKTEADLKALFPPGKWPKLHLQMIYYGREYCPARNHDLNRCAICSRFGTPETKQASRNKLVMDKAAKDALAGRNATAGRKVRGPAAEAAPKRSKSSARARPKGKTRKA
jgi:endonuclease-3